MDPAHGGDLAQRGRRVDIGDRAIRLLARRNRSDLRGRRSRQEQPHGDGEHEAHAASLTRLAYLHGQCPTFRDCTAASSPPRSASSPACPAHDRAVGAPGLHPLLGLRRRAARLRVEDVAEATIVGELLGRGVPPRRRTPRDRSGCARSTATGRSARRRSARATQRADAHRAARARRAPRALPARLAADGGAAARSRRCALRLNRRRR